MLVPKAKLKTFSDKVVAAIQTMYPCENGATDYASIATDTHYKRMHALLDDARKHGCEIIQVDVAANADLRQFTPTIVVNPPKESRLMQEEVFGPILILTEYDNLQSAINRVNDGERPLALYYFGKNKQGQQHVLNQTISGGVAINEVMMQLSQSNLPFGGVGHSGMGSYWGGDAGFKRFSHARSVFEQGWFNKIAAMLDPPYGANIQKVLKMQLKK